MTSILCLAHYCDLHGPTPLMVTEGFPVPCSICDDAPSGPAAPLDRSDPRAPGPGDSSHAAAITEALRRISFSEAQRSSSEPVMEQEAQSRRASIRQAARAAGAPTAGSAIETPPQSPCLAPGSGAQQQKPRQDSGFRRTYDEYVTRRAGPCDNCAMTLPKRQENGKDVSVASRPDRGPTLRTRAPYARVFTGVDNHMSPPASRSSSSTPSEDESGHQQRPPSHRRTGTNLSVTSRSSGTSGSASANSHMHFLDYTSTHEPLAPESFSLVRASCLRTLSLETLPRAPATSPAAAAGAAMPTPNGSPGSPAFVTTHSIGSAASGGSIFFGDRKVGYTTAYIFRVPDVHARGHKRVYAFLALSTHPEATAIKTFKFLSTAFHEMASWIQELAEAEAERALAESTGSSGSSPVAPGPGYGSFHSEPAPPPVSGNSSFLTGGMGGLSRRMVGGFGGSGVALKQRGLAELVGLPDFFIELHAKFVRLLLEIGVMVGS
ncbi:hypothetical protein VTH82DRAFT_6448 [Thermothelomyces myriococcoides]